MKSPMFFFSMSARVEAGTNLILIGLVVGFSHGWKGSLSPHLNTLLTI